MAYRSTRWLPYAAAGITLIASAESMAVGEAEGVRFGGAVRFQYGYEDYAARTANARRGGDLSFDTFAIEVEGRQGDLVFASEYRFYSYMDTIRYAWIGYDFTPRDRLQLGVTPVPFGIMPVSSHNFFFSSNYYIGLEDDYDFGVLWRRQGERLVLDAGFYKNDEQGDISGDADSRSDRYSYDIVGSRPAGEGTFEPPATALEEHNTGLLRGAYTIPLADESSLEIGLSAQAGDVTDIQGRAAGQRQAFAVHGVFDHGPWRLQAQVTDYEFDLDSGRERIAVAAYSAYDTIPAEARSYILNLAYTWPVNLGPVSEMLFYNDHSRITSKSGGLEDTVMNVTGVALTAGDVIAYLDLLRAKNQPFVGGTMDSETSDWNTLIHLHFGWYF